MTTTAAQTAQETALETAATAAGHLARETMNVVIVGHVDHGKSTLVGRLLADTGTLGDGKLEKVQRICKQQGKVFEYAFLLDALEEEQGQGITIDAARIFFKSARRDYMIIDAPGHIEFLKNMVTGAARAEAAVLLIDAKEGVRENSRRHGYLLSMLGIRQVVVAVNKIDLVDCRRDAFEAIVTEYKAFLAEVGITPRHFVPMAARDGDMVAHRSDRLDWFDGPTILEALDGFTRAVPDADKPLRMPVQDVYKWNERGDDRRIIAGKVESGRLRAGDRVVFLPSNKTATVRSIESWSAPVPTEAVAGRGAGVTLTEQIYVGRGELMTHLDSPPQVSTKLRVNLFWLGKKPMRPGQRYKLKLATAEREVTIDTIHRVLDASDLSASSDKGRVDRNDVADLTLHTRSPVAFDLTGDLESTSRFVIVDGYDIAGGGIVREAVHDGDEEDFAIQRARDIEWIRGDVLAESRTSRIGHPASLVMFVGDLGTGKHRVARALEAALVQADHRAYLLDGKAPILGRTHAEINLGEAIHGYIEVAKILLDAGTLVISTNNAIGPSDPAPITAAISPTPILIVQFGEANANPRADLSFPANPDPGVAVPAILAELNRRHLLK
jgi:bifunctional enzyme CysN/CysC